MQSLAVSAKNQDTRPTSTQTERSAEEAMVAEKTDAADMADQE